MEIEYNNSHKDYKTLIIKMLYKVRNFKALKIMPYVIYGLFVVGMSFVLFEINSTDDFFDVFDIFYILKIIIGFIIIKIIEYILFNIMIYIGTNAFSKKNPYILGLKKLEINDLGIKIDMIKNSCSYFWEKDKIKAIYKIENLIYIYNINNQLPIIIPITKLESYNEIMNKLSKLKTIENSSLDNILNNKKEIL